MQCETFVVNKVCPKAKRFACSLRLESRMLQMSGDSGPWGLEEVFHNSNPITKLGEREGGFIYFTVLECICLYVCVCAPHESLVPLETRGQRQQP